MKKYKPVTSQARVAEPVSLYNAKTNLSSLVDRASAGEEFIITKSGKPYALLVPLRNTRSLRTPGKGRNMWNAQRDFDAPLPDDLIDQFGTPEG